MVKNLRKTTSSPQVKRYTHSLVSSYFPINFLLLNRLFHVDGILTETLQALSSICTQKNPVGKYKEKLIIEHCYSQR